MRDGLLIADADASLTGIYEEYFSELGFAIETAVDGLECLTKLRVLSPDVLVVDLDLPWGGGDGVVARIRQDRGAPSPVAVFVTGTDPPRLLAARACMPISRCFQKPFRVNGLVESIRAAGLRPSSGLSPTWRFEPMNPEE